MPRSDMWAIPGKDTALHYPPPSTCEQYGEHQGDSYIQLTTEPVVVEAWTCCDHTEVVGEVFDCDTCLEPGVATGDLPPGWIEDSNGHHCPKCYPKEWAA